MSVQSTKMKLLMILEDIDIVSRELFEVLSLPKADQLDNTEIVQRTEIFVQKEKELKETLTIAEHQGKTQNKVEALQNEVSKRDCEILQLQHKLSEAENHLSCSIYEAKQKLDAINHARRHKVSSEDLIKYAHKISANNSVAAPPTWTPGDTRRPYPSDMEMRRGFLGRLNDLGNGLLPSNLGDLLPGARQQSQLDQVLSSTQSNTIPWSNSTDLLSSMPPALHTTLHVKDEVEEMNSSDTSSTSSSDDEAK